MAKLIFEPIRHLWKFQIKKSLQMNIDLSFQDFWIGFRVVRSSHIGRVEIGIPLFIFTFYFSDGRLF